jgi:hypothetical protein
MIRSRILPLLFAITLVIIGGVYFLRSSDDPEHGASEPLKSASSSQGTEVTRPGLDHPLEESPGGSEVSPVSSDRDPAVLRGDEVAAGETTEEPTGEWNPPIQQSVEDAKNFDENYSKALSNGNYKYAAQLIMRKKCADLEAGPESEDCLPFLREKIREEERLFQSDDLAYFYVAAENDVSFKRNALSAIQRINPQFFKKREACFQWRASTEVEARAGFAGECIRTLVKMEAVGEAETSFWEEYMQLKGVNPERAERFRTEISPLLPELGSPGLGAKLP